MRPLFIDSALKEIAVLSKLRHPNIVTYEGSDRSNPAYLHIYMEYCDGGDLEKVIRQPKTSDSYFCQPSSLWEILFQISSAVAFCHEGIDLYDPGRSVQRGSILHRDIKPSNVFFKLDQEGFPHVKLGDFGTAAVITSTLRDPSTYTGTKLYWAPEINKEVEENIENGDYRITKWSRASDMWSLAKTMRVYHQSLPSRVVQPESTMIDILDECLDPDPEKRPSAVNVGELCRAMSEGYVDRVNGVTVTEGAQNLQVYDSTDNTLVPPTTLETESRIEQLLVKHRFVERSAGSLWLFLDRQVHSVMGTADWMWKQSDFDEKFADIQELLNLWQEPRTEPKKMGKVLGIACRYYEREPELKLVELILSFNPSLEEVDDFQYTPLYCSIQKPGGHLGVLLMRHGADPIAEITSSSTRAKTTPFEHALTSVTGWPDTLLVIREMFKSPRLIPPEKGRKEALTKYLMLAAQRHCPQVVHLLVMEFGATGNVSQYMRGTMSLLQYAALHKDLEMAQFLLDQNQDVHGLPISSTPLQLAAQNDDEVMVQLLLNHGADANKLATSKNWEGRARSPLQAAIDVKNHSMAKALIKAGANPNKGSIGYSSPMYTAATYGDEEAIHILLDAGAESNCKDWYTGDTPIAGAARQKFMGAFKILLDATTDKSALPPTLWILCQYNTSNEYIKILLDRGVDPNEYRHEKRSILYVATKNGHVDVVRLLMEYGADPDAPGDYLGQTPRMIAEKTYNTNLIDVLNGDD